MPIPAAKVKWENIVRGYKVDDNYVVLDESDFEKASPEKSKIIEIAEFVEKGDQQHLLRNSVLSTTEKSGAKPYALLRDALKKPVNAVLGPMCSVIAKAWCSSNRRTTFLF